MIFIGQYVFEVIEGNNKLLKLRAISDEEMGPYRTDPDAPKGFSFSPAIFTVYRESVLQDLLYITKKIFNEGYMMKAKTLESLHRLAKQYEFASVVAWFDRYWVAWEQISLANGLDALQKARPDAEHETNKLILAFKEELELSDIGPELKMARVSYLEEENANLSSRIDEIEADLADMEARDVDSMWIEMRKDMTGYEKLAGKYRSNKITIAHLKGLYEGKKTLVTDDMIRLAKKVPFDLLLKLEQVGGRKRCKCPFHNEKTASFYVYPDTNRGYCHGCGRSADTIQYLVEIKKVEFNQAVLMLLNY